jgi:transposase
MLIVETIAKIRLRHHVHKQSIRQISRELHISRNTVRKVLREGNTAHEYKPRQAAAPKLGEYKDLLLGWLNEERHLPKKQRCSSTRMYQRLQGVGYDGAYDSVQRFVKQWLIDEGKPRTAFIPLYFSPGEAYQFDWSEELVELDGIAQTVKVAHFRLCHSRMLFLIAYPRETQEMLFDAHDKAFSFFGGIPLRGIYDNMKTAVDAVFTGKERKFNQRFTQMLSHYLIEPTACTPAAGWEKGQVENQVGTIRGQVFVPRLKFKDLAKLNQHLLSRCMSLSKEKKHPEMKERTVYEVYMQEKTILRPVNTPFDAYVEKSCRVSSTCLISFDRNRYSVECAYASQAVSLRAYADRIVVTSKGSVIAEHQRHFGRDKTIFNPWHYLPLLERKPGALRNGAPFHEWNLPDALEKTRTCLMKNKGGDKDFVSILLSISSHGLEAVEAACRQAASENIIQADYILNCLNRLKTQEKPAEIQTPDWLKLSKEPLSNISRYNQLLTGGRYAIH